MEKFRFIDLFAGIGGFHIAMSQLGGECVFASEIDRFAIETYKANFGLDASFNIREVPEEDIPQHDVLCAGFPCQAFSKAGRQEGFEDTRGTLFFEILRILKYHKPKYIVLENVRNLVGHDKGRTWRVIHKNLVDLGYIIPEKPIIVSPHQIGVPQLRERVFIPGIHRDFTLSKTLSICVPPAKRNQTSAQLVIGSNGDVNSHITKAEDFVLQAWDDFLKGIKNKVIGFPVWAKEFKGEYDISPLPKWKQDFIVRNRTLYAENKKHIDTRLTRYNHLEGFTPTHTKFEWQAGTSITSVWDGIIQFRPSGIRVKRPSEFPALVAMVHVPILGWEKRRITPREAANLQSFPQNFIINATPQQAFKQFGNSVNVEVVKFVANQLFELKK
jgi:DNA (cytosine-5)-methyltransferase 1